MVSVIAVRLWSIHPQYLDRAGLVALWREALLAQAVLRGETRGYKHHPQLTRFRESEDPCASIAHYLDCVAVEADRRSYRFDRSKIVPYSKPRRMRVTDRQLLVELAHLRGKLRTRDQEAYAALVAVVVPRAHPGFVVVRGPVAPWERAEALPSGMP